MTCPFYGVLFVWIHNIMNMDNSGCYPTVEPYWIEYDEPCTLHLFQRLLCIHHLCRGSLCRDMTVSHSIGLWSNATMTRYEETTSSMNEWHGTRWFDRSYNKHCNGIKISIIAVWTTKTEQAKKEKAQAILSWPLSCAGITVGRPVACHRPLSWSWKAETHPGSWQNNCFCFYAFTIWDGRCKG